MPLENAFRSRAETAGDDDAAVLLERLANCVQRLVNGRVDKPTRVDYDDVSGVVSWRDFVTLRTEVCEDALGIDQGLGATQAHKTDFGNAGLRGTRHGVRAWF